MTRIGYLSKHCGLVDASAEHFYWDRSGVPGEVEVWERIEKERNTADGGFRE